MRTTFYQANYQQWPPVANAAVSNPNSTYWKQLLNASARRILVQVGADAYDQIIERFFPDGQMTTEEAYRWMSEIEQAVNYVGVHRVHAFAARLHAHGAPYTAEWPHSVRAQSEPAACAA